MSRIADDIAHVELPGDWTQTVSREYIDNLEDNLRGDITAEADRATQKEGELEGKFNNYTPTLDIPGIKVDQAKKADAADKLNAGATMGGKEVATVDKLTDGSVTKISDNATNVSGEKLVTTSTAWVLDFKKLTSLENGDDLYELPIGGYYCVDPFIDVLNKPKGVQHLYKVIVEQVYGNIKKLTLYDCLSNKQYYQDYTINKWRGWKEIATIDEGVKAVLTTNVKSTDNIDTFYGPAYWGRQFNFETKNPERPDIALSGYTSASLEVIAIYNAGPTQGNQGTLHRLTCFKVETTPKTYVYTRVLLPGQSDFSPWEQIIPTQPAQAQANYNTFNYGIEGETK